ncbi:MAG: WG repeat-containing protein [Gemmatimonadales bacterium]
MRRIVEASSILWVAAFGQVAAQQPTAPSKQLLSAMSPGTTYAPLWGFINRDGEWVIRPTFRGTQDFSEGLARAQERLGTNPSDKERWGYIDTTGAWVIPPRFQLVYPFSNGLAWAYQSKDSLGFIDQTGRFLEIEPVTVTDKGKARTVQGEWLWERNRSNLVPVEKLIPVKSGKLAGYVDLTGKARIAPQFENARPFSEGLAAVKATGKWGFIDTTGTMVIAPQFGEVERFSGGFAAVRVRGGGRPLWNYVDRSGKVLCPTPFPEADRFSEGLAAVVPEKGKERGGYIDASCNIVIEPQYGRAQPFSDGLALVSLRLPYQSFDPQYEVWYFIDRTGQRVIEVRGGTPSSFDGGVAPVAVYDYTTRLTGPTFQQMRLVGRLDGTYYLDTEGKKIVPK